MTVARSDPAASDDPHRTQVSSIAKIFPLTLNSAIAMFDSLTRAPVPATSCSVDATSTKCDIGFSWRYARRAAAFVMRNAGC